MTIENLNLAFDYSYIDAIYNESRIEFHVDYWSRIIEGEQKPPTILRERNATTSIRALSTTAAARPIMIVGQDRSVFAQYLLGSKTWTDPKGQRPLLPKSEGDSCMLSAFVSREFGFRRELSEVELATINAERLMMEKTYVDS